MDLVYGGGGVGLMGALADSALAAGVHVTGVIPSGLERRELAHQRLDTLMVVQSMHERKARMAELADGFVTLPGGYGTLEEIVEMLTWAQLGIHQKPCGLLNVAGYFDGLIQALDHFVDEGLLRETHRSLLIVEREPRELLKSMGDYRSPVQEAWLDERET